jgi:Protein of unknown function (DUF3300)
MRKPQTSELLRILVVALCIVSLAFGDSFVWTQDASSSGNQSSAIPPDQLDSLVAPIALYPDPLLAQVLAASTYPLEIIQLQQWLEKNKNLKGQALADAVAKEPWDPSVESLAAVPDVAKRLANDIQWTTDLGNAFLAQEADVMAAVQRMRKKAEGKGNLKSTEQQKVETQTVDNKSVIVIQPASQEVVYVPSYDPVVVYGPPVYPYPPIYYPPPGYYAAGMAVSFGVGMAMGAFWGGGYGWNCGWGGNNIYVNRNNNFYRNTNIRGGNRASTLPANGRWQHNPQHRGGAPYRDPGTANRFGGTTRGDSLANRQSNARQQLRQQGGNVGSNRPGGGLNNRPGGGNLGDRGGAGNLGNRPGGGGNLANRPSGGNVGNRPGGGNLGGGGDRIGSRDLSGGGNRGRDAFGGGGGGFNGSRARTDSNRGAASMGSRGGGSRGGFGGGGGGRRGGGGGRRR